MGLNPFLLGWLLSLGMTTAFIQTGTRLYIVIGLAMLTLWMVVSDTFGFKGSRRDMALTMLCINLPALVVLVLLGIQEPSLHAYQDNAVDLPTQFSYLSLLCPGTIMAMWTEQVFWSYFGTFLLLVLSPWPGYRTKNPMKK